VTLNLPKLSNHDNLIHLAFLFPKCPHYIFFFKKKKNPKKKKRKGQTWLATLFGQGVVPPPPSWPSGAAEPPLVAHGVVQLPWPAGGRTTPGHPSIYLYIFLDFSFFFFFKKKKKKKKK
jgi:hypothetical protein